MIIDQKIMDSLSQQAKESPRLRQAFDLRTSPNECKQSSKNRILYI